MYFFLSTINRTLMSNSVTKKDLDSIYKSLSKLILEKDKKKQNIIKKSPQFSKFGDDFTTKEHVKNWPSSKPVKPETEREKMFNKQIADAKKKYEGRKPTTPADWYGGKKKSKK